MQTLFILWLLYATIVVCGGSVLYVVLGVKKMIDDVKATCKATQSTSTVEETEDGGHVTTP